MSKNWKKWFSRDNLLVLVLGGVLLFIIALPTKEPDESVGQQSASEQHSGGVSSMLSLATSSEIKGDGGAVSDDTDDAYVRNLEQRLTDILSKMENVGKVQVLITLKSSEELIVEKEQPVTRSATDEKDSAGGSRMVSEMSSEENTVYRTDGSNSEPYVVKTLTPTIEGVLVVAEGAGSGTVSRTITEIVQTLFGVDAHKVKVVRMESGK